MDIMLFFAFLGQRPWPVGAAPWPGFYTGHSAVSAMMTSFLVDGITCCYLLASNCWKTLKTVGTVGVILDYL